MGELLRRPARALDDGRGLRRAAPRRGPARRRAHAARRRVHPKRPAASSAPGSSRGSGWPCSACGRGTSCRCCRPSSCSCRSFVPLNIYDFGCWARQTVVALTVVSAHRPVHDARLRHRRAEERSRRTAAGAAQHLGGPLPGARPGAQALRAPAGQVPAPGRPATGRALDPAAPGGGRLLGRHPAAVGVLADRALRLQGYALDHPVHAGGPRRPRRLHHRRRRRADGSRPASRRSGTPPSP